MNTERSPVSPNTPMRANSLPVVCVVILNYQKSQLTLNCLESLKSLNYPELKIVVVDNGSGDDSISRLKQFGGKFHLIESPKNLGFSGGCNLGIDYALENQADYIWLLNNDTVVDADSLTPLVQKAQKTQGLVSSVLYYLDHAKPDPISSGEPTRSAPDKPRYQTAGVWFNPWTARHRPVSESELHDDLSPDSLSGASLLIPAAVVRRIGKLDESYFLYFEDSEYTVRARKAGIPVGICLESRVFHHLSGTSRGRKNPQVYYYIFRNKLRFAFASGHGLHQGAVLLLTLYHLLIRSLKCLFNQPERTRHHRAYLRLELLAFGDFLRGVSGACPHRLE